MSNAGVNHDPAGGTYIVHGARSLARRLTQLRHAALTTCPNCGRSMKLIGLDTVWACIPFCARKV